MKLKEIQQALVGMDAVNFQLPDKSFVPAHFHVTEVGIVNKKFIDCGGVVREENVVNFQLWEANDFDHRLSPAKLIDIITLAERIFQINPELEVEVEYQGETIGKFGLEYNGTSFQLTSKLTACLAEGACGIPKEKLKVNLGELGKSSDSSCVPGGGCC